MGLIEQKNLLIMIKTENLEANLFSVVHPHISKRTSVVSLLLSLVIALVGIVCIVSSLSLDNSSAAVSMTLLTLGTIFILFALYRAFWRSVDIIYTPTGSVVCEGTFYVDSADLEILHKILKNNDFKHLSRMSFKQNGNGRIDCMFSKDGEFVAVQLFHFVPFAYEPFSAIYYYVGADAKAFKKCIAIRN